jgi:polyphosphate kinase
MVRNLSYRIETAFPIYDPSIQQILRDIIDIQLNDNVKSRTIDQEQLNNYRKSGGDLAIRSQIETYYYFKRREENS